MNRHTGQLRNALQIGSCLRRELGVIGDTHSTVTPTGHGFVNGLASGDVIKVAEVVRDLFRRDLDRGLSAGEKRMLAKARAILISELALAENTDEAKAESILDEVLAS